MNKEELEALGKIIGTGISLALESKNIKMSKEEVVELTRKVNSDKKMLESFKELVAIIKENN